MTDASSAPFVVALCLAAILASFALVRRLMRRPGPTLRAKVVTLIIGMVGVELSILPAFLVAVIGDDLLGWRGAGIDLWIVIPVYAGLTVYVILRLFPWREVQAMAADPDASLRDLMARMAAKNHESEMRDDGRKPPSAPRSRGPG